MPDWPDILWSHTWWRYDPTGSDYNAPYHWFNLFEAGVWFVFGVLVLYRWGRHRHSLLEPAYAAAFVLFGVTDVLESQALTSWLIWLKLANLIGLIWLRAVVIRRFYPTSKLF